MNKIRRSTLDGVKRGLRDVDCNFDVLTLPQIVDVVARLAYIHTIADMYLHNETEIVDEIAFKTSAVIQENIRKRKQTRYD